MTWPMNSTNFNIVRAANTQTGRLHWVGNAIHLGQMARSLGCLLRKANKINPRNLSYTLEPKPVCHPKRSSLPFKPSSAQPSWRAMALRRTN